MRFLKHLFKPVSTIGKGISKAFNGAIVHPLDNVTSGIGNFFSSAGTGVAKLGSGLGSGVSNLGQGIGNVLGSPILLIGGAVVLFLLINK